MSRGRERQLALVTQIAILHINSTLPFTVIQFSQDTTMAFMDPFAAYSARDSTQAHSVCSLIQKSGIKAYVIEDVSDVGSGLSGPTPELQKPQVWIERADADRVKPVLDDYEQSERERLERESETEAVVSTATISVVCDKCDETLSFPAEKRGSVEVCPHCLSYLDVEDTNDDGEDEWWLAGSENEDPPA